MQIVVVPHRHREAQLAKLLPWLQRHFNRIIIIEPVADQPFDRGWVKNVGFRLSHAGPLDTVYFHDVDVLPVDCHWLYPPATRGTVMHLYGHRHCLGGIVGVDPAVFHYVNGFSHNDNWGGEDRDLQRACQQVSIPINRTQFKERFAETHVVIELNDSGNPESTVEGRRQLNKKWTTHQPRDGIGALDKLQYAVKSQKVYFNGARHYIVKKY